MSSLIITNGPQISGKVNDPYEVDGWVRAAANIFSLGYTESIFKKNEKKWDNYLNNAELLGSYQETLNTIAGNIQLNQNSIITNRWELEDLNHDKVLADDFLEDYRQMLAGTGDSDNTLLMQDRINQQNISNAEADLAAYRDSSALELDSMIRSGFEQYVTARDQEAVANVYASATGSVVGSFNSAAKRTRAAIRTFVGDDMVFDQKAEGTSIYGKSGASIGTFAQMMLSSRQTVKNNIAKLNTAVDSAKLVYQNYRDQMKESAYQSQVIVDRYGQASEMLQSAIENAQDSIKELQQSALETITNAKDIIESMNKYETNTGYGDDLTTWDGLDDLYAQYGGVTDEDMERALSDVREERWDGGGTIIYGDPQKYADERAKKLWEV